MSAAGASEGDSVYLTEDGREGVFVFSSANLSAQLSADPLRGIYIPPSSAPNGASGAWVRQWDDSQGRPEWFYDNSGDWRAAFSACVSLCPVTLLGPRDYHFGGRWQMNTPYRTLRGEIAPDGYRAGNGARLISTNPNEDVFLLGAASRPAGGSSAFTRNMTVENVTVMHDAGLVGQSDAAGNRVAVRAQYNLLCQMKNVRAWEPLVGFKLHGCVQFRIDDCLVFRNKAYGGTPGFIAFWAEGTPDIGLAGGNASLYLNRCLVEKGQTAPFGDEVGFLFDKAYADNFATKLETSRVATGMRVIGVGGADRTQNVDFSCSEPRFDQCEKIGIDVSRTSAGGTMEIAHPYVSLTANGFAAIYLHDSNSSLHVLGGQLIDANAEGSSDAIGVYVQNSAGVNVDGTSISNLPRPLVLENASSCRITPQINNQATKANPYQAAIFCKNTVRCHIAPSVRGKANAFPQGIHFAGTANTNLTVDPTQIDPASLSGGKAANKILVNGAVSLAAPGYFASTGTAGTPGQGINVVGITA